MNNPNQELPFADLETILQQSVVLTESELVTSVSHLLCQHPDFQRLCEENIKKAALYKANTCSFKDAFDLYEKAWTQDRRQFEGAHLKNALSAFFHDRDPDKQESKVLTGLTMLKVYFQVDLLTNKPYDKIKHSILKNALRLFFCVGDFAQLREMYNQLRLAGEIMNSSTEHVYAASAYQAVGDYETACDYWTLLFNDINFKEPTVFGIAIQSFFKIGDFEKAKELLDRYEAIIPNTIEAYLKVSAYYNRLKDNKKAILYNEKAEKLIISDSESSGKHNYLSPVALLYSRSGRLKESTSIWNRMREAGQMVLSNPKVPDYLFCAYLEAVNDFYAMGDFKSASDYLEEWRVAAKGDPRLVLEYKKMHLGKALTCHIAAREDARALEFIKANSTALEKYAPRKSKDVRPVQRGGGCYEDLNSGPCAPDKTRFGPGCVDADRRTCKRGVSHTRARAQAFPGSSDHGLSTG